jgi:hypothetical protein
MATDRAPRIDDIRSARIANHHGLAATQRHRNRTCTDAHNHFVDAREAHQSAPRSTAV